MPPSSFAHVTLRTERLLLRPFVEADAPALFALFSDSRVSRYLSRPAWADVAVAQERIARDIEAMRSVAYLRLAIERSSDGQLIGELTLFNRVEPSRRAEVGYALAPAAQGRGHAVEAMRALLGFAFDELALNRLEADIDPRNLASARVLDRLGFRQEGLLRERWVVAGEVSDSALYGLLASDWRAHVG